MCGIQQIDNGGPGAIRTPDPQIRSLMLYPAELRVLMRVGFSRVSLGLQGQKATSLPMKSNCVAAFSSNDRKFIMHWLQGG